jgi:uncharacterized membrane-anchored protein
MGQSQVTRVYRLSIRAMLAGVIMLAGAVAAFAASAPAVGLVFLVVMLACVVAGFVCAVIFRNRAVALARAVTRDRRAGLSEPPRHQP